MKILVSTTLLFFILIFSSSCEKILTPVPEQLILNDSAIRTVKDVENILNGAYDGLQSGNVLGGNMSIYADFLADDLELAENLLSPFGTFEIYFGQTTPQIGALRGMWADCYKTISKANFVIDAIDNNERVKSDPNYNSKKDIFKGEALFIRSIVHFELMKFWALPFDIENSPKNSVNQSGIVLRTKPSKLLAEALEKTNRSTIEACYNQIIDDLKNSEILLEKSQPSSNFKISADAAKALLARVYFFKGDYSNATVYSNKLIQSNRYSLTDSLDLFYRQNGLSTLLDINGGSKPETIFQLVNTITDNSNSLISYYSGPGENEGPIPSFNIKYDNYISFNSKDRRKKMYLINLKTKKYPRTAFVSPNICVIRFAEIHLIRAEANLLSGGSTQEALDSYNFIRRRAFKANYVEETSTVGLLDKVRTERRLEMMCEQGDRYMNLRRLRLPLRKANENEYSKFLFKIPQEEISANPDLLQN